MKRNRLEDLIDWKTSPIRKPLILQGARQVGKTWLLQEFGRTCFNRCAYVNFEDHRELQTLFADNFDIERIVSACQIVTRQTIIDGETLLVLDEFQEAPNGLAALKYFAEKRPELHVVAAGSLLGLALHRGESFPVGKVDFMHLAPLSFREFLSALGEESLANAIRTRDWSLLKPFDGKLQSFLKTYLYVGGMPEAVEVYCKARDFALVRQIQNRLLLAYEGDLSKHAPTEQIPRIQLVWRSLLAQLARENRKFKYAELKHGGRAKEFELAIQWLVDAGLVHRVPRVSKPDVPLAAYADASAFKLFGLDVGLLAAMGALPPSVILNGSEIFEEFKGALTEQYVLEQLVAAGCAGISYWSNDRSTAEVDFLIQKDSNVVPIEVKTAENLRSKSFRLFCETHRPKCAVRASLAFYKNQGWMENLPLWAI